MKTKPAPRPRWDVSRLTEAERARLRETLVAAAALCAEIRARKGER